MNWKDMIPGCCGNTDKLFASHSDCDGERAKQMLKEAKKAGATLDDVEKEYENFLTKNGAHEDYKKNALKDFKDKVADLLFDAL